MASIWNGGIAPTAEDNVCEQNYKQIMIINQLIMLKVSIIAPVDGKAYRFSAPDGKNSYNSLFLQVFILLSKIESF